MQVMHDELLEHAQFNKHYTSTVSVVEDNLGGFQNEKRKLLADFEHNSRNDINNLGFE